MNPIIRHFDASANDYQQDCERFPWNLLRRREKDAVFSLLPPLRGKHIVELGSGAGYYTRALLAEGAACVTAVDASAPMLAQLPCEGVIPVQEDATIYLPRKPFDQLCAFGIVEFLERPQALLEATSRYATAGTPFTILYPRDNFWGKLYRRYHRGHGISITLFNDCAFESMAGGLGWKAAARCRVFPFSSVVRLERAA